MSLFQNEKKSYAGTWGEEVKIQYHASNHERPKYTLTTCRESYDAEKFKKSKEDKDNKFMKFRDLKSSGAAILDSQKSKHNNNETNDEVKLLNVPDYPVAVGRSGLRTEKGVSTSGLLGERLMLSKDPKYNSFAQRSWLYSEDPALNYRVTHLNNSHNDTTDVPVNPETTFSIGNETKGSTFKGWTYHRKKPIY